jgi:hypothetical protein
VCLFNWVYVSFSLIKYTSLSLALALALALSLCVCVRLAVCLCVCVLDHTCLHMQVSATVNKRIC